MKASSGVTKVQALHADWIGVLSLSVDDGVVVHEGIGERGAYELEGTELTVRWKRFPADTFSLVGEVYVQSSLLNQLPDLRRLVVGSLGGRPVQLTSFSLMAPSINLAAAVRPATSDIATYEQIFLKGDYDSPHLPPEAQTILDLGANIGLSALFFGARYPRARIVAVEPDKDNYSLLIKNVEPLGSRVACIKGAVWPTDGTVTFEMVDAQGANLDYWGGRVEKSDGVSPTSVRSFNIGTLCDMFSIERIDILKVDIEGAELEVFSEGYETWLSRVNTVVVETHERFRPGSEVAVRRALAANFVELPGVGENLVFRAA